jgi:hypothetical protein
MLMILSAALFLLQSGEAPLQSYACADGKAYTVKAAGAGLNVAPAGLPARTLSATGETHLLRFSNGGLSLIRQGNRIMIGAPELESDCKPVP